jgi:hypothetical protein
LKSSNEFATFVQRMEKREVEIGFRLEDAEKRIRNLQSAGEPVKDWDNH